MDKTKVIFPIRVYETFAGIGAQLKAITNIDKDFKSFKVVKTTEWDARAIIAYSQIHHKDEFNKKLKEVQKWDEETINDYLKDKTFSLDSKKPGQVLRKDLVFKQNLISANIVNNNNPDITQVKGEILKDVDLVTYSFPCQGLSIANMGRGQGIKEDSNSTSNLVWQIRRMLLEANESKIPLPKYLLMENVKNLLSKKHIKDYNKWLDFLSEMGYTTKTMKLNGWKHGSLQKRVRVFAISVLNWKGKLSKLSDEEFQKMFDEQFQNQLPINERKNLYKKILTSSEKYIDEIQDSTPKETDSRKRMAEENKNLLERKWSKNHEWTFNTLTTKQDRHPNIGMINLSKEQKKKGKLHMRFITPREAYQIMGFTNNDFTKVKDKYKEKIITKESLYRQAGNSIVVSVLEDIFKFIKKFEKGEKNE